MANDYTLAIKIQGDSSGASSAFDSIGQKASGLGGIFDSVGQKGSGLFGALTSGLGAIGLAKAGFDTLTGAAGKVSDTFLKTAGDLQQSVANIRTLNPKLNADELFSQLNKMQTEIPQSAAALGDSLYNIVSSIDFGDKTAEQVQTASLALTETFGKGAVAASTDAQTFGTAISGVLNAYKLDVSDANHVSDVFFNTVNAGVINGQELSSALGPVSQSAKAAGVSFEQLGGLIAGVTKEGGPAAQNVNNLNNFLMKVTTSQAQDAMKKLGVSVTDATGHFKAMPDVLTDLKGHLATMTAAEKNAALQSIFPDSQARQAAQTLMSQLDFVKGAIDTNIHQSGAAADAYTTMSATFKSQSVLLKNSVTAAFTTIGGAMLPAITPAISGIAKLLQSEQPAIQKASLALGKDLAAGLSEVGHLFSIAGDGVKTFTQALSGNWTDASGILPWHRAIGEFGLKLHEVQGIVGDFGDKLESSANPTVAKLGGALSDFAAGDYGAAFRDLKQAIGPIVTVAWNLYQALSPMQLAFDVIKGVLTGGLNGGLDALGKHFDKLSTTLNGMGPVGQMLSTGLDTVKGVVMGVANAVRDNWPTIVQIFNTVKTAIGSVIDKVSPLVSAVINLGAVAGPSILQGFGQVFTDVAPIVGKVLGYVGEALSGLLVVVTGVVNWVSDHWPEISATIAGTYNTVIKPALDLLGTGIDFVAGIIKGVIGFVVEHWPEISATISFAWNNVISPVLGFLGSAIGTTLTAIKGIISWVSEHWPEISSTIKGAWDTFIQPALNTMGDIINNIVLPAIKGIISWVSEHWPEISSAINTAWTTFIKPALDGIGTAIGTASDAIKGVVGWVKDNFHFFGDVISTVTSPIKGILGGISDAIGAVSGALDTLMGKTEATKKAAAGVAGVAQMVGGVAAGGSTGGTNANLKSYDVGGWVDAPVGAPQLAIVHGGEYVVPADAFSGTTGTSAWSNSPIPPIQTLIAEVFNQTGAGLKTALTQIVPVLTQSLQSIAVVDQDNATDPARLGWSHPTQDVGQAWSSGSSGLAKTLEQINQVLSGVPFSNGKLGIAGQLGAVSVALSTGAFSSGSTGLSSVLGQVKAVVQNSGTDMASGKGGLSGALAQIAPVAAMQTSIFNSVSPLKAALAEVSQTVADDFGKSEHMNDPAYQGWFKPHIVQMQAGVYSSVTPLKAALASLTTNATLDDNGQRLGKGMTAAIAGGITIGTPIVQSAIWNAVHQGLAQALAAINSSIAPAAPSAGSGGWSNGPGNPLGGSPAPTPNFAPAKTSNASRPQQASSGETHIHYHIHGNGDKYILEVIRKENRGQQARTTNWSKVG